MAWFLGIVLILGLVISGLSRGSFISILPQEQPPAPVATIVPPPIPHTLEGRADCRLCHEKGIGGAPQFPADHSRRPSDICIVCHIKAPLKNEVSTPTAAPSHPVETTPTAVSAKELFGTRCAACHGANRQGIPGLAPALTPESLTALSDTDTKDTIFNGRTGSAMPAFKGSLTPEEIDALLQLIKHTSP
ncbi:MAG: c-type cytochrome [Chloroflexi bacterium]|nr:c-type cytochrome [Chloroflexota bacterium]